MRIRGYDVSTRGSGTFTFTSAILAGDDLITFLNAFSAGC